LTKWFYLFDFFLFRSYTEETDQNLILLIDSNNFFLFFLPNYYSLIFIDLTVYIANLRSGLYMFDNTGQQNLTDFRNQKLQYTFPKVFGALNPNLVSELLYHVSF